MTDGMMIWIVIGIAAACLLLRKKKDRGVLIIETWELVTVPRRRTLRGLVNIALVAGIALFIWVMAHGQ